jgi:hypothetical protein
MIKRFIQLLVEIICLVCLVIAGTIFLLKEDTYHFQLFVLFSLILIISQTSKLD